jgi:hypothetical protein
MAKRGWLAKLLVILAGILLFAYVKSWGDKRLFPAPLSGFIAFLPSLQRLAEHFGNSGLLF